MRKFLGLVLAVSTLLALVPKHETNAADNFNFPRREIPTTKQAFVGELYRCFLGHEADQGGLEFWTNNGASVDHLYQAFVESGEYQNKNLHNVQFIYDMYNCVLYRQPDHSGFNFWLNDLNSGRKTRTDMLYAFLVSIEFDTYVRPNLNYAMTNIATSPKNVVVDETPVFLGPPVPAEIEDIDQPVDPLPPVELKQDVIKPRFEKQPVVEVDVPVTIKARTSRFSL